MSIVFAGTPINAATTLRALHSAGVDIALVITRPDAMVGRKRVLTPSPVAVAAHDLGLPIIKTQQIEDLHISEIKSSGARLAVVVAFGALLRDKALEALELGWFNLHYSMLPSYRGAAPVQHALLHGETNTGVTLFKIDAGLDTGPIVNQVPAIIEPYDNAETLLTRLTALGASLLLQEIPRILSGVVDLHEQPETPVTMAPKPSRSDAQILKSETANRVIAKVHAFNPEPGAWLFWQGSPFKIHDAASLSTSTLNAFEVDLVGEHVVLGTVDRDVRLIEVQPAGKSRMKASDWYRGTTTETRRFD